MSTVLLALALAHRAGAYQLSDLCRSLRSGCDFILDLPAHPISGNAPAPRVILAGHCFYWGKPAF